MFPKELRPGMILRHARFYVDRDTGEFKPKFLVVLACSRGGDIVVRLLTSRQHGRPEQPPCYHGDPYPGFYLGVLGLPLVKKSWLDLRGLDDVDSTELTRLLVAGEVTVVKELAVDVLHAALNCSAAAMDTTTRQERAIRDQIAAL
ncbi:MAG: hypothetical protein QM661_15495 [Solimonas sp.]